ncbi:MAG: sigma factor, partial [Candidatus Cloacimonadaceae bacterium]|nr:sigma factor [Candidatus Cloacimonadaceae bacterium]
MATMHYEARNIDKDAYDAVIDCIADMSKHGFEHMNIQNHATNNTMLRLIKTSLTLDVIKSKVQEIYPKVIEELFSKYHNIAFRYCLQKTRNSDVSNEIAQETITRLLRTQNRIDQVETWVIKVAHNLLCEHSRGQKQE